MSTGRILKWVSGGLEAFLGFPIIGGAFILSLLWTPLLIMLALHIVTLIYAKQENLPITGSVLGIVTSVIGWIPFVGMVMHIISAIFLMLEAGGIRKKPTPPQYFREESVEVFEVIDKEL